MTCDEGRELIQRSIDSDLDSQETVLMNEHIRTCPDCAVLLDRLTLLSKNLAELPRVTPPFSLVDAILPKLELIDAEARAAEQAEIAVIAAPATTGETPRRRNRSTLRRLTGAIAAGIVAGLVIIAAPSMFDSSSSDNDSNASVLSGAPSAKESAFDSTESVPQAAADSAAPSAARSMEEAPDASESMTFNKSSTSSSEQEKNAATPAAESPVVGEITVTSSTEGGATSYSEQSASPSASPSASSNELSQSFGAAVTEDAAPAAGGGEPLADKLRNSETGSLLSVPLAALVWVSPDQKLKAVAEEQRVSVYSVEDGSLVFQSAVHSNESLSSVYWEQDSSALRYSWKDADGNFTDMAWNVSANAESRAGEAKK